MKNGIDLLLERRLTPLVERRRWQRVWLRLAGCWAMGVAAAGALVGVYVLFGWVSWPAALVTLGVVGFAAVVSGALALTPEIDWKDLARRVEHLDGDLRAMLLTAVEQRPSPETGKYGYLQERLLVEAVERSRLQPWIGATPRMSILGAATLQGVLLLAFLMLVSAALWPAFDREAMGGGGMLTTRPIELTVSPGDTEVERGAAVVVIARFGDRAPAAVELEMIREGREPERVSMSPGVGDPVFGRTLTAVNEDVQYRVIYGDGEGQASGQYTISVFEQPRLLRADALVTPPAFANEQQRLIEDTRRVSAPVGSHLRLTFTVNKEMASARFVDEEQGVTLDLAAVAAAGEGSTQPQAAERPAAQNAETALAAAMTPPAQATGPKYEVDFTLERSAKYRLHLTDAEGRTNRNPPEFVIEAHENSRPKIELAFPSQDLTVTPIQELDLEARVSDDYGLRSVGVSYALAGGETHEVRLAGEGAAGAESVASPVTVHHTIALERLGAEPNELLTYFVWAEDMGSDGQLRRTESDIYFAEVGPYERIFREGLSGGEQQQQQQQQGQQGQQAQLAEVQKQIIVATWNLRRRADSPLEAVERLKGDTRDVRDSQTAAIGLVDAAMAEAEGDAAAALAEAKGFMEEAVIRLTAASDSPTSPLLTEAITPEQAAYQALLRLQSEESQVARGRQQGGGGGGNRQQDQMLQNLELKQEDRRYETQSQAQQQQQEAQAENLAILNRLRDLARRQQDLAEQLRQARAELAAAQTAEEREEIERRLKRLREQQEEALREIDDLRQRMDRPENRDRTAEARERMDEARERAREAAESLEAGDLESAAADAGRVGRDLEQLREEFQRSTSSRFAEAMRELREEARGVRERQRELAEEIENPTQPERPTLSGGNNSAELADQLAEQTRRVEEVLSEARQITEQSEASEPLLSRRLYDTLRQAEQDRPADALRLTEQLVRHSFRDQAGEAEQTARSGIESLTEGIEGAAEGVLGDEVESLRLARAEVDEMIEQIRRAAPPGEREGEEGEQSEGGRQGERGEAGRQPGENGEGQTGERGQGQSQDPAEGEVGREGTRGEGRGDEPRQEVDEQERPGEAGQQGGQGQGDQERREGERGRQGQQGRGAGGEQQDQAQDGQQGEQGEGQQGGQGQRSQQGREGQQGRGGQGNGGEANDQAQPGEPQGQPGEPTNRDGQGGGGGRGDINELLRQWAGGNEGGTTGGGGNWDQVIEDLRDIQDMLGPEDLRRSATQVRDRARSIRAESRRHSLEPQWEMIENQVLGPLVELSERIGEELARRELNEADPTPIDRDPVPRRYAELVRRYYRELGEGN